MSTHAPTRKILILVAEPTDAARLRLGRELREIQLGLRQSVDRDRFEISHLLAVQPADLRREVLNARPRPEVVHFCGHGAGRDGLVLEDDQGKARLVPTD
ncbi:MAG TPA: hypothetical protein VF590_03060, partial [Isosphaeraceae bacterium]